MSDLWQILVEGSTISRLLHPFTLLPFCISLIFLYRYLCSDSKTKKNLPPSPPKLPIIGNFHQFGLYPHRSLQSLSKKHGELMSIKLGKVPFVIVCSANAASEIMKTNDATFSDRPYREILRKLLYNNKDVASAPYGEHWRQMRSAFVLHLSSNTRVRSYSRVRDEETALVVEKIKESVSKEVNLSQMFMNLTNDVICRVAYGKKYDEAKMASHKRILDELNELLGGFFVGNFIPWLAWIDRLSGVEAKTARVAREFDELLEGIIQEHVDRVDKDSGADENGNGDQMKDFVDVLLELQRDKTTGLPIDAESLKGIILDTFVGGTDTTYTLLEWAMSALLKHPRTMRELQNEIRGIMGEKTDINEEDLEKMKYLKAVIKETLRLHPPLPLLVPRQASNDTKLLGYDIPKGTTILTNAWAVHRDPRYWEEPEDFRPERFLDSPVDIRGQDFSLIPFGAGRRGCPGISFAMAINELVLANLVHKFNWALPGGAGSDTLDMTEVSGLASHRKIPLVAVPSLAREAPLAHSSCTQGFTS